MVLNRGHFSLSPKDIWQCLETFWLSQLEGACWHLAGRGHECCKKHPLHAQESLQADTYPVQNVGAKVEKPWISALFYYYYFVTLLWVVLSIVLFSIWFFLCMYVCSYLFIYPCVFLHFACVGHLHFFITLTNAQYIFFPTLFTKFFSLWGFILLHVWNKFLCFFISLCSPCWFLCVR